jgi:aminoglycoside 3-N-acetyltransferase
MHLGVEEILQALRQLGRFEAPALLVHSSLSACGTIDGGASTFIAALRDWSRPATLAMPTHSYCFPEGALPAPCFDPVRTPSHVGAITNDFWRLPGVIRSLHPTHSLACAGPLARELCTGHEWAETPCGPGTPYARLLQLGCAVLMLGCSLEAYTLFHTAEDAASVPYLYKRSLCEVSCRDAIGIRWSWATLRHDMEVTRRFAEMDTWLEQRGLLQRVRLGLGTLLFIPDADAAHRALVSELRQNPWLLVAKSARSG